MTPLISPLHRSDVRLCKSCQYVWPATEPSRAPEWVKLIPAGAIPVFCLSPDTLDQDVHRVGEELRAFFGEHKVLVIRGEVEIYAIVDQCGVSTEGASWAMEAST